MFKLKNLYIAACLLGLTIYAAPAWASICFAPSGGCVDPAGQDISDNTGTQGALNECIGFTLYAPEEGDGWHCSSCVQTSGKTLYKCTKNECASEYNIKKDGEEPPKALPGWECEACMRGYEKFWKCQKHYCSPKYGEKKHSASAAKFTCEGSNPDTCPHGDDTLYNCECTADHVEREINGVASCVRLCTEEHREYNQQTDKCECEQYYHERNGKCVHDDYNGDCQAILNNFYAVNYSPLSSSECDSLKIRLGIKKCLGGSDYWAGAVKKCGGVDYMPTSEQLTKLAQCMYNSSSLATSIYGKRNDSYLEELGLSTDDNVSVWQDYQNKNNTQSMVRIFAKNRSIPYWAERDGSKYYIGNGTNPTTWENNSILSQTLCRKDTGADVTPTDSCDSSLGEYERESDCKNMGWPCAKEGNCWKRTKAQITYARSNTCNPVLIVQGSATTVTITPNTNTTNQQQFVDAGNNELSFGLSTGIPSSFKIGGPDGTTTLTVPVTGSSGTITIGTYNFKAGKSYQITPNCNGGNNKVTVYYDAPTNCNYSFNFTNKSTNAVTQVGAATQTIVPGTYTVRPSTMGVQSFTIKMGRGGTQICYNTSGTDYTFSIGNEYWIVPNCSSTCSGSSGTGSDGNSGDSSTTSCSGARPIKFINIPMTSSSSTCIDVCCGPNADVPSSYSYLGDCNSVGSTYTCPPTTSMIKCYRDVQGILHETEWVETGGDSSRHCIPGWIQIPHYTRCFGSYLVGC